MTRWEINSVSRNLFLKLIDEIKIKKGYSEYRIMMNCKKLQPEFNQRGLISQVRNHTASYISLSMCVFIAKANDIELNFSID